MVIIKVSAQRHRRTREQETEIKRENDLEINASTDGDDGDETEWEMETETRSEMEMEMETEKDTRHQTHEYETSGVASYFFLFQFTSQIESILSISICSIVRDKINKQIHELKKKNKTRSAGP